MTHISALVRIRYFTWTWFTMTMATGGIASMIYYLPFRFQGLTAIGDIFFVLNMILFLLNIILTILRFSQDSSALRASFLDPTESLFIPASVVSFGIILMNISQYGLPHTGPWLRDTLVILFWMYYILAIITSCGLYLIIWNTQQFNISEMTPVWIFPAYPFLLIAPLAAVLTGVCSQPVGWRITIGAIILQGVGFLISLMIYSAFIHRLMTHKLPAEAVRPGMFISVGPSGFTAAGILGIGFNIAGNMPYTSFWKADQELLASFLYIIMQWASLCIWGLAIWFFILSVGAHISYLLPGMKKLQMTFSMTWYSFVFPNTALVVATLEMGRAFDDNVLKIFGTVMAVLLILLWVFVFAKMLKAVMKREILWPVHPEPGACNES